MLFGAVCIGFSRKHPPASSVSSMVKALLVSRSRMAAGSGGFSVSVTCTLGKGSMAGVLLKEVMARNWGQRGEGVMRNRPYARLIFLSNITPKHWLELTPFICPCSLGQKFILGSADLDRPGQCNRAHEQIAGDAHRQQSSFVPGLVTGFQ